MILYRRRKKRRKRKYLSPEGEKLRSKGEWIIEHWFHAHNVKHIYEPRSSKEYYGYIPDWLTESRHIIEFFGFVGGHVDYDERTKAKIKYFRRKFGKKFIPLFYEDLDDLNNRLRVILK